MVIGVGVIGLGVISGYYLPALARHPGVRVPVLADTDPAKRDRAGPRQEFCLDHREVLARADVDAVVVNVPNHLHHRVCRDALAAGKHVCCEKPLALEPDDAADLETAAAAAGRVLFTAFHRRYNANVVALRERMARRPPPDWMTVTYRERIEDHCGADSWYLDADRCGGGCLADNGPNALDTAMQLLGPLELTAARTHRDREGVDRQAWLSLASGAGGVVRIVLDWAHPGEDKQVHCEWADGHRDGADMLAGFVGFKSSLHHEYDGVVDDFAATVLGHRNQNDTGRRVVDLVARAYGMSEELVE